MMRLALVLLLLLSACHTSRTLPGPDRAGLASDGSAGATGSAAIPAAIAGAASDASPDVTATPVTPTPSPTIPKPTKVRISLRAVPRASVSWGRKTLGNTPLTVERPYDSGPMDLVFRAAGHLTTHSRAYTFRNDTLDVHLTRTEDAGKILGAKKVPPPGTPVVPGTATTTPPAATAPKVN